MEEDIGGESVFSTSTEIGYAHMRARGLRRARFLFRLLAYRGLFNVLLRTLGLRFLTILLYPPLVRRFFLMQFCGGASRDECKGVIDTLWAHSVGSILDYAVETSGSEEEYDAHTMEIQRAIHMASKEASLPFVVLKMSSLGNEDLMARAQVTSLAKEDALVGRMAEADENAKAPLSEEERTQLARIEERFEEICSECAKMDVPLLVDAEALHFQSYVAQLVYAQMEKHNQTYPIIYYTFQLYCKNGYDALVSAHKRIQSKGFILGAKLVRGAYMEAERARAEKMGYANPIHDTKADCDADYNKALAYSIQHIKDIALVAGTHNEESCCHLARLMQANGIARHHPHVHFSQLYGMCDPLSFGLAHAGYSVSKYLPYGPWRKLIPYLYRRAMENSALSAQSRSEVHQMTAELQRRKQA